MYLFLTKTKKKQQKLMNPKTDKKWGKKNYINKNNIMKLQCTPYNITQINRSYKTQKPKSPSPINTCTLTSQCFNNAKTEKTRDNPTTEPETGTMNPAPTTGPGAGAGAIS